MRVIVITRHGGPEVLQVAGAAEPALRPGRGPDRGRARPGVNFADTLARVGLYPDSPEVPCVVGYEVAGTIAEVGEGVTTLAVGDRVMAGTQFGGYAEEVVVAHADAIPLPDGAELRAGRRDAR